MVMRKFMASDSQALKITSDSPFGTAGSSIINNSSTPDGTVFQFTGGYKDFMISLEDSSSDSSMFNDNAADNHVIVDGKGLVADGTKVESESHIYVQKLDAYGFPTGPQIKLTVFSKGGNTSDVWGFATDGSLVDGAKYVKVMGSNYGDSKYSDFKDVDGVPCFAANTHIATPAGPRKVQDLCPGDLVLTFDHGPQPVQWATSTHKALPAPSKLHPILISAGALGCDLPFRDLIVSPQHRVLIRQQDAEIFAPAKALTSLAGIRVLSEWQEVEYFHILLPSHAVILSEGLATESFFPGPMALAALSEENRSSLSAHIGDSNAYANTCRPTLSVRQTRDWLAKRPADEQGDLGYGFQTLQENRRAEITRSLSA
ncbi:Hint domain-containing protein [Shimia sp. R9_2]|uniref:Hint domain-containing protein n=1 Tax=Shimia sp. R9_2 TaxID=2821112 RepID=UPI001ADD000C|nr:Hint domain-containing protein [Shimia sp. R9_2]MBO9397568.1 Hint domain-containing protein [Shimia sp. R9_2]